MTQDSTSGTTPIHPVGEPRAAGRPTTISCPNRTAIPSLRPEGCAVDGRTNAKREITITDPGEAIPVVLDPGGVDDTLTVEGIDSVTDTESCVDADF